MKTIFAQVIVLVAICGCVFFTNLGASRLWDRDEPRNAGCALEMMENGNLVVPIFNDELRFQKPALLYWLIISAYSIFGVGEFAARFWSAIFGIGSVLATYGIASRLFNRQVGFLAGMILATCGMFVVASRAATPDSLLIFFSTMAIWFYVAGTFQKPVEGQANDQPSVDLQVSNSWFPQKTIYVIGMYTMMGLGVLAKGPVAFVLPMAIIGMSMLLMRLPIPDSTNKSNWLRRLTNLLRPFHPLHFLKTLWSMKPIIAIIVILTVAAPWYFLVAVQTQGDWTTKFFLDENIGRASNVYENHSGGFWYYPLAILLGFFPWSVFAGPTLLSGFRAIKREAKASRSTKLDLDCANSRVRSAPTVFLFCWVGVQVGIFTLASTKLPSYVTPCYPALAILTSCCLINFIEGKNLVGKYRIRASLICLAVFGVLIAVAVGFAVQQFLDNEYWLIGLGLIPAIGGLIALMLLKSADNSQRKMRAVTAFAGTAFAMTVLLFGYVTLAVDRHQESHSILTVVQDSSAETKVASYYALESTWVFYGGKPIYELASEGELLAEIPERADFWAAKPRVTPQSFVNAHSESLIITVDEKLEELQQKLDCPVREVARCRYFFKDKELVLLQTVKQTIADKSTSEMPDSIKR